MSKQSRYMRQHRQWLPWVWPLLALLLALGGWSALVFEAEAESAQAEQAALKEIQAYAEAYERYLTRSIGQLDQVTMQLKQSWEQSPRGFELEALRRAGMFTDSAFVSVSILDERGNTLSSIGRPVKATSRPPDYFVFHRNNISNALRIGTSHEPGGRQSVVQFTRRLDGADDEFRGVVRLVVDADFFTSYYGTRTLGRFGSVTMSSDDGVRLERHGDLVALADRSSLFTDLDFPVSPEGARVMPGQAFADARSRILGWRKSSAYGVTAMASIGREDAMFTSKTNWRQTRDHAIAFTALLAAVAACGMVLSRRAMRQRAVEEDVQRAYRTATESANEGFYMVAALANRDGTIHDFEVVDCNERGAYFYGQSRKQLIGTRLSGMKDAAYADELMTTYRSAMRTGFHEDERRMPIDNRLNIAWGKRRIVRVGEGLAITLQDTSERKNHERDLMRLASQDALTGLPNRHWLGGHLPEALIQAGERGHGLALLFIDLDDFKSVNDTQGHAAGDHLLQMAASRLKSLLRPSDSVVRFGGDEFIVLLDPAETDQHVAAVAERILGAFGRRFEVAGECHLIGASIGISVFPRDGLDAETLIKNGDIAMYAGKDEGKGQYRFFDPVLCSTLKSRAQLKHELSVAIETGQLELHYQPRVHTSTGLLCSMEALLRWRHPEQGMISPADFIPVAESSGLILAIGDQVIDMACAQLAAWRSAGVPLVPVSVNVSPKQFDQGNIHRQLVQHLSRYHLEPSLLEVEITESTMMADRPEVLAELTAIRALGIKLHVDDFGTGYSSLSQLQKLKMDVLKVDKAFTRELDTSKEGRVFFQAIVSMAHALGMTVVAEGVETGGQLQILRELECDELQGYHISRPVPANEMAVLMRQQHLLPARVRQEARRAGQGAA